MRPSWHPARVVAAAPDLPERIVTAMPDDTLAALATRTGTSPGALAAANHLAPNAPLAPGQRVIVPAGRWHVVRPGETGIAVARAYRAAWPRVIRANGLVPPYALEVGDRLLIPAPLPRAVAPGSPPANSQAHAFNLDIDALLGAEPPGANRSKPIATPSHRPTPTHPTMPATTGVGQSAEPARNGAAVAPAIHLQWPLTGRILSAFGPKPGGRFNDGINIAAIAGAPVRAAADGAVAYAGNGVAAFGGLILVRHAGGWLTAYAHLDALLVAKGDTVRAGQTIARAGATGEVDAPQLHFEVRRGRTPVDPARMLPRVAPQ